MESSGVSGRYMAEGWGGEAGRGSRDTVLARSLGCSRACSVYILVCSFKTIPTCIISASPRTLLLVCLRRLGGEWCKGPAWLHSCLLFYPGYVCPPAALAAKVM